MSYESTSINYLRATYDTLETQIVLIDKLRTTFASNEIDKRAKTFIKEL